MTNLGGHDLDSVREAFHGVEDDRPHCFIAYTIKGFGLPFAGHKDNHAGLMTPDQMAAFKEAHRIADGAGVGALRRPRRRAGGARGVSAPRCRSPRAPRRTRARRPGAGAARRWAAARARASTQEAFGRIMGELRARRGRARARASSPPRPTSRCRPASAPGSAGAACSTAPSMPTCSRRERVASAQLWAESRRRPACRARASPRTTCS